MYADNGCKKCARGTYSKIGFANCKYCNFGNEPNKQLTNCTKCDQGRYRNNNDENLDTIRKTNTL